MKKAKASRSKKAWLVITFILLAIVLSSIPFVIRNIQIKQEIQNPISSADFLGYFGSLLGAIATILAVGFTLNFTLSNQKAERKLSIKPFLQSSHYPLFIPKEILDTAEEYKALYILYPFNGNELGISYDPPYHLKQNIGTDSASKTFSILQESKERYYLVYKLENVGAGNAVNIDFTIDNRKVDTPFAISSNGCKFFILQLGCEIMPSKEKAIELVFHFSDIASYGRYEQKEIITLKKEDDGAMNSCQSPLNVLSIPVEISNNP